MSGSGTYKWKDGKVYIGEFYKDKRHGKGSLTWPSGKTYDGEWVDGKMHGEGKMKNKKDGQWVDVISENGKPTVKKTSTQTGLPGQN
jgi:hypothetical protein